MDVEEDESSHLDPTQIHPKFRKAKKELASIRISQSSSSKPSSTAASAAEEVLNLPTASTTTSMLLTSPSHLHSYEKSLGSSPQQLSPKAGFGHLSPSPTFPGGTKILFPSPASSTSSTSPNLLVGENLSPCGLFNSPHLPRGGFGTDVFRFDSSYLYRAISEECEEVFAPSPASSSRSYDSPHIVLDSPRITISPLCINEDSAPSQTTTQSADNDSMDSQNHLLMAHMGLAMLPSSNLEQRCLKFGIPSPISPLTPNTPLSPSPLFSEQFQQGFLAELYRRRCHSDSDIPQLPESSQSESTPTNLTMKTKSNLTKSHRTRRPIPHPLTILPSKGGSLESDQSSPQDSPLDLSMRGSRDRFGSSTSCESLTTARFLSSLAIPSHNNSPFSPGSVRSDISSPTAKHSVALKYNLDVSPVVEEIKGGSDALAFVCPVCGQMFSLHDRLAKHMASRHKSKPHDANNRSYPCDVCHRSFARSDMLTRHLRLHSGIKPYSCRVCGQVFSRSDHLSTHRRTHTGEKPYACPQCPYAACRRDMITRHLRTHSRNSSSSTSSSDPISQNTPTTSVSSSPAPHSISSSFDTSKRSSSRPPSSASSFAPDSPSPLSPPALASLSVNSPPPERSDNKSFFYK